MLPFKTWVFWRHACISLQSDNGVLCFLGKFLEENLVDAVCQILSKTHQFSATLNFYFSFFYISTFLHFFTFKCCALLLLFLWGNEKPYTSYHCGRYKKRIRESFRTITTLLFYIMKILITVSTPVYITMDYTLNSFLNFNLNFGLINYSFVCILEVIIFLY